MRKRGGQPGNKNAVGNRGGAPVGNKNAVGHRAPYRNKNAVATGEFETIILPTDFNRLVARTMESQGMACTWGDFHAVKEKLLKFPDE